MLGVPLTARNWLAGSSGRRAPRLVATKVAPFQFKAYKWLYLIAGLRASTTASVIWQTPTESGSYTLQNPTGGGPGTWGTGVWGTGVWGAGATKPVRVPINGYGDYIDITFTDGGEAQSAWSRVEVDGFAYGRRY